MDYDFMEALEGYSGINFTAAQEEELLPMNCTVEDILAFETFLSQYEPAFESLIKGQDETKEIWKEFDKQHAEIYKSMKAHENAEDYKAAAEDARKGEALAKKMADAVNNIPTDVKGTVLGWISLILLKGLLERAALMIGTSISGDKFGTSLAVGAGSVAAGYGILFKVGKYFLDKKNAKKMGLTENKPMNPGDFNPFIMGMRGDILKAAKAYSKQAEKYEKMASKKGDDGSATGEDDKASSNATESFVADPEFASAFETFVTAAMPSGERERESRS